MPQLGQKNALKVGCEGNQAWSWREDHSLTLDPNFPPGHVKLNNTASNQGSWSPDSSRPHPGHLLKVISLVGGSLGKPHQTPGFTDLEFPSHGCVTGALMISVNLSCFHGYCLSTKEKAKSYLKRWQQDFSL